MKTTAYSVADLYKFVKTYDKYFTPVHSVSPEALNPDGTPKEFFHGTRSEFDEFLKSAAGRSSMPALAGFWFTGSKAGALAFAENTWYGDKDATVYDVYLSMRNPKIYESEDTTAHVAELEKETAKIDSEMSLLDSVYNYSEKGERFHRYREYDRSKRRRSNIDEWEPFRVIVEKYDADVQKSYLDDLSAEERKLVKADNEIIDFLGRGKNKPRIYVPANLSEDIVRWFDVPGRKAIDTLRNKYIGNMTITSDESARGIDSLYGELSEKFGQVYHIKR